MRFQIDYSLKGVQRTWCCETPRNALSFDDAVIALLRLHLPFNQVMTQRSLTQLPKEKHLLAVQELGISDIRIIGP